MQIKNYINIEEACSILGVNTNASIAEIKTAFRKKAKFFHPDLFVETSKEKKADAEKNMRMLLNAYKFLLNEYSNRDNNVDFFSNFRNKVFFDYRTWLLQQSDYKSRAKLIFLDLFHGRELDAITEYNKCKSEGQGFQLSTYFERGDFMDCGFVLAEELYFREDYYESFLLLEEIFYLEKQKPYFKHFFPEVISLLKSILKNKLPDFEYDDLAIDCYEAALNFGFDNLDNANILKNLADTYIKFGKKKEAEECLTKAYQICPKLSGLKKIKNKLEAL